MRVTEQPRGGVVRAAAAVALLAVALLAATAEAKPPRFLERELAPPFHLEASYALSYRDDRQSADRIDASAQGLSPTGLRVTGAWFLEDSVFGLAGELAFERYSLAGEDPSGQGRIIPVKELRAQAGLALRAMFGRRFALEGCLGYGYGATPSLEASASSVRGFTVQHHGPALAMLLGWERGAVAPRLRARAVPLAFGQAAPGAVRGWMAGAGAEVGFAPLALANLEWSTTLGYEYSRTQFSGGPLRLEYSAHLFALGLRVTRPGATRREELPPPTGPGIIRGILLLEGGQAAADLELTAGASTVRSGPDGRFVFQGIGPGPVELRASAPGHKLLARQVEVPAEDEVEVELRLTKPTGPGRVLVKVLAAGEAKRPPVAAHVAFDAGAVSCDATGSCVIEQAGPGLVPLKIAAAGFKPAEEVVSVPPEGEARIEIALVREKVRPLASLRGLVRDLDGKPLRAQLHLEQAGIKARTGADGRFRINLPGGRYRVEVRVPGFVPQTKTVEVADGDQAIFNLDMHPSKQKD